MRTVQLDEDVYEHLRANIEEIGESASDILRRLLQLRHPASAAGAEPAGVGSGSSDGTTAALEPLRTFLQSERLRYLGNTTDRYLALLAFAHDQHPEGFSKVLGVSGRKRLYFAGTCAEIENSGNSTYPQQIPGTEYWAMTNTDTKQKRDILGQVLQLLGFRRDAIAAACRALDAE